VSNSYNPTTSETYADSNNSVTIAYGKGKAVGVLSTDNIIISDINIDQQEFVLVTQDHDFDGMKADGILGMGLGYSSNFHHPLIFSMILQGKIEKPIFSVFLSSINAEVPSNVMFGELDLEKYSEKNSTIKYLKTLKDGYWSLKLNSVDLDHHKVAIVSSKAILDTGSSLISGPESEVNQLYKLIRHNNTCNFDQYLYCKCSNINKFPKLKFTLENTIFELLPENYMIAYGKKCQILITSSKFISMWILGDVFLRRYYTVFDLENLQIGLVRSVNKDIIIVYPDYSKIFDWVAAMCFFVIGTYLCHAVYQKYITRRVNPGYASLTEMSGMSP
jgi:saccharopepsin